MNDHRTITTAARRSIVLGLVLALMSVHVGLLAPSAKATHHPPEFSSGTEACFGLVLLCSSISVGYYTHEDVFPNTLVVYRADASSLLPGVLDMRVTIKCVHSCNFWKYSVPGGTSTQPPPVLEVRGRCAYTTGGCSLERRAVINAVDCDYSPAAHLILEVNMAASDRFNLPGLSSLPPAYAQRTDFVGPCQHDGTRPTYEGWWYA